MAKYARALNIVLVNERMSDLGLNQAQLAEKICVSSQAITHWFKEKYSPSWQNIVALAKALDVPTSEILINNPNRVADMQSEIYGTVKGWIDELESGDIDNYRKDHIETASNLLATHFERLDLNKFTDPPPVKPQADDIQDQESERDKKKADDEYELVQEAFNNMYTRDEWDNMPKEKREEMFGKACLETL